VNDSVDPALVAIRVATYGLAILSFGGASFRVLIGPGGSAKKLWPMLVALAAAAAVAGYLALLAREIGGAPSAALVAQLIVRTGFGRALQASLAASLILAGLNATTLARPRLSMALAGVALAALAFVGHAADGAGPRGALRLALMALHLLAAGVWLGALPALAGALRSADAEIVPTLRRFGNVAGAAVAVLLATGLPSLAFVVVDVRGALGAGYLKTFALKLSLVAGLLGVAAVNRFYLTKRAAHRPYAALAALRLTLLLEQALGLGVIATVALLGQLDPAM
jgi:copper resistance protein D